MLQSSEEDGSYSLVLPPGINIWGHVGKCDKCSTCTVPSSCTHHLPPYLHEATCRKVGHLDRLLSAENLRYMHLVALYSHKATCWKMGSLLTDWISWQATFRKMRNLSLLPSLSPHAENTHVPKMSRIFLIPHMNMYTIITKYNESINMSPVEEN